MSTNSKNNNISGGKKVFVALSGGVDSAVSAALLKEQGFDVTGVFIKVWQADFLPCHWRDERRDAMKVCIALDIPFLFLDLEEEYKQGVVDEMVSTYKDGRTPNPDILCNRIIKFGAFWQRAQEMGADYIATGHYVRTKRSDIARKSTEVFSAENLPDSRSVELRDTLPAQYPVSLLEGSDKEKDQSYFLWTLTQDDLKHSLFPVGHLEKSKVRHLAKKFGLPVAEKKDSQGICFIGDVAMDDFLSHFVEAKSGKVFNTQGQVIGRHKGAIFYTIGERHGFDVIKKQAGDLPFYVVSKDMKSNTITVSNEGGELVSLSPTKVTLKDVNWITEPSGLEVSARIRYRGEKLSAKLVLQGKSLVVEFRKPVRGLSLGQSIVFYLPDEARAKAGKGEICLGGAVMDKILK